MLKHLRQPTENGINSTDNVYPKKKKSQTVHMSYQQQGDRIKANVNLMVNKHLAV